MQARFYLPMYGRFASPDPARDQHFELTQSWNIYSYVRNSPTMMTDPTGLAAHLGAPDPEPEGQAAPKQKDLKTIEAEKPETEKDHYLPDGNPNTLFNSAVYAVKEFLDLLPIVPEAHKDSGGSGSDPGARDASATRAVEGTRRGVKEGIKTGSELAEKTAPLAAGGLPAGASTGLKAAGVVKDALVAIQTKDKKKGAGAAGQAAKAGMKMALPERTKKVVEQIEKVAETVSGQ